MRSGSRIGVGKKEAFSLFIANAKYYTELVAQPPQHLIGPRPRSCDGSTLPYPSPKRSSIPRFTVTGSSSSSAYVAHSVAGVSVRTQLSGWDWVWLRLEQIIRIVIHRSRPSGVGRRAGDRERRASHTRRRRRSSWARGAVRTTRTAVLGGCGRSYGTVPALVPASPSPHVAVAALDWMPLCGGRRGKEYNSSQPVAPCGQFPSTDTTPTGSRRHRTGPPPSQL